MCEAVGWRWRVGVPPKITLKRDFRVGDLWLHNNHGAVFGPRNFQLAPALHLIAAHIAPLLRPTAPKLFSLPAQRLSRLADECHVVLSFRHPEQVVTQTDRQPAIGRPQLLREHPFERVFFLARRLLAGGSAP